MFSKHRFIWDLCSILLLLYFDPGSGEHRISASFDLILQAQQLMPAFPRHVSSVDSCGNINGTNMVTNWVTDRLSNFSSVLQPGFNLNLDFDHRLNLLIPRFGAAADLYSEPLAPRPEPVLLTGPYKTLCPFNCMDLIYCLTVVSRPKYVHSKAGIVRTWWGHSRHVICYHPDCLVTVTVTLPLLLQPGQIYYTCALLLLVKLAYLIRLVKVYRAYAGTVCMLI